MASLAAFTVRSVATGILEFCVQRARYEEIIVSGGGAKNPSSWRDCRRLSRS